MASQARPDGGPYESARTYALAFSYRDIAAEVDAILRWATPTVGRPISSVIELAAGPADHSIELAARGLRATAVDNAPAMRAYARSRAALAGVPLNVVTADMCAFEIGTRFDLAIMMINSIAYILDEASLDAHFQCVAAHLSSSGCYIIEASHPDDHLRDVTFSRSTWVCKVGDETVEVQWGEPGDAVDAASGIHAVTVTMTHYVDGQPAPMVTREVVQQHLWTRDDLLASVARVGGLQARGWFGSFDGANLDDVGSWRMFAILQKC